MKRTLYILLCASVVFAPLPAAAREDDCGRICFKETLCDIKHELRELNEKQSCTKIITAKDIGTNGYVINDPGYYCLGEDVNFAATQPFTQAIQVLANNVTINMEGHTLAQLNQDAVTDVYGILIGQGYNYTNPNFVLQNITITNGTISNFSGVGIFAYNGSFDEPSYAQIPFQGLAFSDLSILGCGVSASENYFGSGINLDSAANDTFPGNPASEAYHNVLINGCKANGCFGNGAITILTVDSLVIQDTQANDMFASFEFDLHPDVDGTFAYNIVGSNIQMFNCQGNRTTSYDPTYGGQVGGLSIETSTNIYVKDSQFNQAYGTTSAIVNNNLSLNTNAVYENCQFNDNQGGPGTSFIVGVHGSSGSDAPLEGNGIRWINCQFNGISVDPTNPGAVILSGFYSTCLRNMVFDDCQACNITTTGGTLDVAGYAIFAIDDDSPAAQYADSSNLTFRNCIASDIQGTMETAGYLCAGPNIAITGTQIIHRNVIFENCIAQHIYCQSTSGAVAGIAECLRDYSAFIQTYEYPQQINLFVRDCRISDIKSIGATPSPLSAGILAQVIQYPVIQNNSVSDCDRGILLTGTDAVIPNGFELALTAQDAIDVPPVYISITAPSGTGTYSFTNTRLGVTIFITPDQISNNFVLPAASVQDWLPGDPVVYARSSVTAPEIPGLVSGTTYYAVVYIPGFSRNGVVQNNEVDNCSVSGYQDDSSPYTTSAWINNAAILNGAPNNYQITWQTAQPIDSGFINGVYPTPGNKYNNLSLDA